LLSAKKYKQKRATITGWRYRSELLMSSYRVSDALIVRRFFRLVYLDKFLSQSVHILLNELTLHHYNHCPEITYRLTMLFVCKITMLIICIVTMPAHGIAWSLDGR
jgi:hypothetical protein